ncbi:MAG: diguanylate cyclase [Alphaproteobacteria bacterium]|uniref:diguanylate cyclase n=1 Tax=Candidatus Nitrobium versatile TaxID=2884831 RepID=A0A953J696_9BACT|nr:diguanylate cyclase [Candidatus Nitrobium versatile]
METDLDSALVIAQKIRNAVESHCFERAGKVTVSCGVTEFKEGDLVDSFMKRGDDALYKEKKGGRNRVEALSLPQWIPFK